MSDLIDHSLRNTLMDRATLYFGRESDRLNLVERTIAAVPDKLEVDFEGDVVDELYTLMHQLVQADARA